MAAPSAHAQNSLIPDTSDLETPGLTQFAGDVALDAPSPATLAGGLNLKNGRKDPSWAKFASGTGNLIFLGAGTLLPLVEDGKDGAQHSIRTADSVITATILSEGLKRIVHKKRPDGGNYESFPSGHATAAFAVATMQAHYHPKQAVLWYAGATTIAASRVKLRRHYTIDVIAGAALGFGIARLEIGQKRGLLFRPFIHEAEPGNRVTGMSLSNSF